MYCTVLRLEGHVDEVQYLIPSMEIPENRLVRLVLIIFLTVYSRITSYLVSVQK